MSSHHEVKYYKIARHVPACVQLLTALIVSGTVQIADSETHAFNTRLYYPSAWCVSPTCQCRLFQVIVYALFQNDSDMFVL